MRRKLRDVEESYVGKVDGAAVGSSRKAILGLAGRWSLMLGVWIVMKWPVLPVSAMQVEVEREKGGAIVVDGEESETMGVVIAGTSSSVILFGRLVGATSTDKVRGGSAGPRS